jgi:hypothetical protein
MRPDHSHKFTSKIMSMKKHLIAIAVLAACLAAACKKEYTCVCTVKSSGQKNYGDKFKIPKAEKSAYEATCKANEDASTNLEDCHLE